MAGNCTFCEESGSAIDINSQSPLTVSLHFNNVAPTDNNSLCSQFATKGETASYDQAGQAKLAKRLVSSFSMAVEEYLYYNFILENSFYNTISFLIIYIANY